VLIPKLFYSCSSILVLHPFWFCPASKFYIKANCDQVFKQTREGTITATLLCQPIQSLLTAKIYTKPNLQTPNQSPTTQALKPSLNPQITPQTTHNPKLKNKYKNDPTSKLTAITTATQPYNHQTHKPQSIGKSQSKCFVKANVEQVSKLHTTC
jgi:hypothetical protein